jgi:peptide/nickel transport system permease protein
MKLVDLVPGGVAYSILGPKASPQQIASLNHQLHLDQGIFHRYATWLGNIATGNLGRSPLTNQPVFTTIVKRLPVTLELVILTQLIALVIAIPLGLITAYRQGSRLDRLWAAISSISIATPAFVLALVLSYLFAVRWHVFPVSGWVPLTQSLRGNLKSAFLPALTLAIGELAVYSRVLRSDAVSTMRQDYILAARARGLRPSRVLFRHALRPSSLSLVTLSALSIGRLLGGTVIVENIFALPGIGKLMIDSILTSDLVVVQGIVVFVAVAYVAINLTLDVTYGYLDPRVRRRTA